MSSEGSSSLHRTLAILQALGSDDAAERGGLGVVEVARRVGREKTQVSRALKALDRVGMVERDAGTRCYRLGWQVFTLASNAGRPRLVAEAPPVLRSVVNVLQERVHLTVLTDGGALTVLSERPCRAVQATGWIGRVVPLHTTSSGRALLFDHSEDEVRHLLAGTSFPAPEPNGPRDVPDFLGRLARAREAGHARVEEEFEAGLVAVAAPVRDFRGRVTAALNVSGPAWRMGQDLDRAARVTCAAAHRISRAMAGLPATPPSPDAHSDRRTDR
ncbi:IclR family transcriptional regulator [Streptomyces sp. DSM 42041]|uniref:IclR family transcriptional regulator n=1 Tax=Streptomyces hazeniae TaxID=3075538 RepID=A0ABU2NVF6_9ACTN|nr:IclR family transcriptional regulator [Streptomyces sp. DSM 42041]MDT0379982.1 IclR family transcriptional regulator [Streptomyces sp. DSM 42041]